MRDRRLSGVLACIAGAGVFIVLALLHSGCSKETLPKPVTRYPTLPPRPVPAFMKDTFYERTELIRNQGLPVSGYGLIANLDGTGDGTAPTPVRDYVMNQMIKHGMGSSLIPGMKEITPSRVLNDPRFAIVEVDALLPPGVRKGQAFDVEVFAIPESNTASLARGDLYETELRLRGADPRDPGGAVNVYARSEGPVFVNPAYALEKNPTDPAAKHSLRHGVVMDGGKALEDRPLALHLLQPQNSLARRIEQRIDQRFQSITDRIKPTNVPGLAEAVDEGIVNFYVPASYAGDWQHFADVVMHLYFYDSPDFVTRKAIELADEAVKPDARLFDISYCWEALGSGALTVIRDRQLMTHPSPEVAFAATRAAAFLGDTGAPAVLARMAATPDHPFQINAVQVLAALSNTPALNEMVRPLLDADQTLVRLEAYKMLARNEDNMVFSKNIKNRFRLDIVRSSGPPLIYATRRGGPRIALIGNRTSIELPATFSLMGGRLTISSDPSQRSVTMYYRPPVPLRARKVPEPIKVASSPDVAELIARLGGEGFENSPGMEFNYGEIVAILSTLSETRKLTAVANGAKVPAAFKLQELPQVKESIDNAPPIPDSRPQADEPAKVGMAK